MTVTVTRPPKMITHFAHAIGGGWDIRHAGCAAKCCESHADSVTMIAIAPPRPYVDPMAYCGGCDAMLCAPANAMDFDRDEVCDACADDAKHDAGDDLAAYTWDANQRCYVPVSP